MIPWEEKGWGDQCPGGRHLHGHLGKFSSSVWTSGEFGEQLPHQIPKNLSMLW